MESARQSNFRALTSAHVALETIEDVLAIHRDCFTVALIEFQRDEHGIAMPIEGPEPVPDRLIVLDDVLLRAVGDDPQARIVFGTVRESLGDTIAEDDIRLWRRLLANHAGRQCRLVDWFVLGRAERRAVSLAHIAGPAPQW